MADQLYLSLWFPNFRLEALPAAMVSVLREFAKISGTPDGKRVSAASTYPISFTESPVHQRIYVNDNRSEDTSGSIIENAVAEATEQLHDDMAYEFEMMWNLWTPESGPGSPGSNDFEEADLNPAARLDALWRPQPSTVKIIGFGPHFDEGSYEQNGHIRVDFGLDYPWVLDEEDIEDDEAEAEAEDDRRTISIASAQAGSDAATFIQKNVETLLAFTLSVEKHCGISSRLLWTESGEPLAEKLIARLQRLN